MDKNYNSEQKLLDTAAKGNVSPDEKKGNRLDDLA